MDATIRSLSRGRRYSAEETEMLPGREHKEIKLAELEAIIAEFAGDEPWILILAGGPKYATILETGPNGGMVAIHRDFRDS